MIFDCPNLAVPMDIMQHVVRVESSGNPFAIGVVGGRLARQPQNLAEAIATVKMLEQKRYNFSLGVAQVNRYNLAKYGLNSYEQAFQVCPNLQAGSRILRECYNRSKDWGKSFSCYYSGNFVTGYQHGYVQKIFASMRRGAPIIASRNDGAITVISNANRKVVPISNYPSRQNMQIVGSTTNYQQDLDADIGPYANTYMPDPSPQMQASARPVQATLQNSPAVIQPQEKNTDSSSVFGVLKASNPDNAFVF